MEELEPPTPEPIPEHRVYTSYDTKKSWADALAFCEENHEGLAVITNDNENEAVYRHTYPHINRYWIGLNDRNQEGVFKWADGTQSLYMNWQRNEPNNAGNEDCAAFGDILSYPRDKWNDAKCTDIKPFVCYDWSFTEVMPPKDKFFVPKTPDGKDMMKNYNDAKRVCVNHGGKLASIRNAAENEEAHKLFVLGRGGYWIGLNDGQ